MWNGDIRMMECKMMEEWWKMKNQVIMKLDKVERLFEENRTNIKYKKGNKFYTIHGGDYKRKIISKSSHKLHFWCHS